MEEILKKIKQSWNDNPMGTAAVGALVVTATAKFIDAVSTARGRRTWEKEVRRRERMGRK